VIDELLSLITDYPLTAIVLGSALSGGLLVLGYVLLLEGPLLVWGARTWWREAWSAMAGLFDEDAAPVEAHAQARQQRAETWRAAQQRKAGTR
jgi:hypothetical protein